MQATYYTASQTFEVLFNRYLQPAALDRDNWILQLPVEKRTGQNPVASMLRTVTGATRPGPPVPGAPTITYDPPPTDVLAVDGTPAPAFTNFPLTIAP